MIRRPWRSVIIPVNEHILQRGKYFLCLGIASISELVINVVIELVFSPYYLLDFISVIDSVFKNFFKLSVVGVETDFALM